MQKQYITLFLILLFATGFAQNNFYAGALYGESTPFRNSQSKSYYNYANKEVSLMLGKHFAWKKNQHQNWNKYWIVQLNQSISKYHLLQNNHKETSHATFLNGGLKLEKPITKQYNLEGTLLLGAGYHHGLSQRLSTGIFFREALVIGINRHWKSGLTNYLGLGFQHASNANLYSLNRGYELLFIRLAFSLPKKSL